MVAESSVSVSILPHRLRGLKCAGFALPYSAAPSAPAGSGGAALPPSSAAEKAQLLARIDTIEAVANQSIAAAAGASDDAARHAVLMGDLAKVAATSAAQERSAAAAQAVLDRCAAAAQARIAEAKRIATSDSWEKKFRDVYFLSPAMVAQNLSTLQEACCFLAWCGMPMSVAAREVGKFSKLNAPRDEILEWAVRKLGPVDKRGRANEGVVAGLVAYVETLDGCGSADLWSKTDPRVAVAARALGALFVANEPAPWA